MASNSRSWDLIIITTSNSLLTNALEKECEVLSQGGFLPAHDELMVVTDPHDPTGGGGVGSGGATINAVLIAAETLSAKKGRSMIDNGDLEDSRVLVLHAGRPPQRQWLLNPAHLAPILRTRDEGYPFAMDGAVPAAVRAGLPWPASPLLCSMWAATQLARNFTKGLWISSVDSVLLFPQGLPMFAVPESSDAVLFTVPVPAHKAVHHGVVITDSQDTVLQLLYQPELQRCQDMCVRGGVPVMSGQLYLPPEVCGHLLTLRTRHPFTHCTYHAADSGLQPFSVSLYFELVAALCATAGGKCCTTAISNAHKYSSQHFGSQGFDMRVLARQCAEKTFSGCKLKAHRLDSVEFLHCLSVNALCDEPFLPSWKDEEKSGETHVRSVNSNIFDKSHLIKCDADVGLAPVCCVDCNSSEGVSIQCGEGSILLGLLFDCPGAVELGSNLMWQQCCIKPADGTTDNRAENIVVCFGVTDQLFEEYPKGGIFNMTWARLEDVVGDLPDHFWDDCGRKTPYHARLFSLQGSFCNQINRLTAFVQHGVQLPPGLKYYSLAEVAMLCCPKEFRKRRHHALKTSVVSHVETMMPYVGSIDVGASLKYLALAHRKSLEDIFALIHDIMSNLKPDGEVTATGWNWSAGRKATRLLAVTADVLSALAGWQGNIRTGPASNRFFAEAFQQLQEGSLSAGVEALQTACHQLCVPAAAVSCAGPAALTRAARHYQRAVELLVARQVLESVGSVSKFRGLGCHSIGVWVEGRCPARLDLAGGWSDTPPVCYELGGAVLNIAICVNGEMPITVRGRWNQKHVCGECCPADCEKEHKGVYCLLESGNAKYDAGIQTISLHWTELKDLADYNNPLSPGALVKAALVHSGIVDLSRDDTLDEQLSRYAGWLELQIISRLPSGSGLGGSSLIGGALLAVLADLRGQMINAPALMHATLGLEQRMTTGGGWQDQVGGLYGGAKLGVSYGKLPFEVEAFSIPLSPELLELINSRLLLLYTGQVRLAKNILQNVVRSWYTGNDALHETFSDLIECALTAASALVGENLDGLATCISQYWQLKKTVAAGSEPEKISKLFHTLLPYVSGASLAGAGGGGYLYGLLKSHEDTHGDVGLSLIEELARSGMEADRLEVSLDGLTISVKGEDLIGFQEAPEMLDQKQLDKIKSTFEQLWTVSKKPFGH